MDLEKNPENSFLSSVLESKSLRLFLFSFFTWNCINLIVLCLPLNDKHLKRNDMYDFRNRIVAAIHGTSAAVLTGYALYFVETVCGS